MKKKWTMLLVVMFALTSIFLTSCSDDDDSVEVTINSTTDFVNYLDSHGKDIGTLLTGFYATASAVNTIMTDQDDTNDYYIMDIRASSAYEVGHIADAVNVVLGDVVTAAANAGGKPIVVACYSGQSAAHAVMALRLSGYEAQSLLWGMSGWTSTLDSWTGSCVQLNHASWVDSNAVEATMTYSLPIPGFVGDTDEQIVANRITAMLDGGFKGVTGVAVLDSVAAGNDDFFINNYWVATDVGTYGNIDTAYRINPLVIENLDPAKTIVTYCWTGQTSSMITAYLTVIGYDAVSLKNGANSMIYDDLIAHKWAIPTTDLPLVTD
ncbi:MAG: rhodanese-like domain-containing protein [Candidatus Delongbacteria bacterium]|nr:rhodanese-like domain-containing protein [Candidatus Delongbacteria bacterium]